MLAIIIAQADLSAVPPETFKWTIVILIGLVLVGLQIWTAVRQNRTSISPQPLTVEVVKALHEQFADKEEFKKLAAHVTNRHGQLFSAIDKVERDARAAMDRRFEDLNTERRTTLQQLNEQFTFIRENIAAIKTELEIRNEK